MLLSEPQRTNYDLEFNLFGFPVRIHPLFFILPVVLGLRAASSSADFNAGVTIMICAVVFFISILVHEMGHALAMRFYGQHARIVLYIMGGLAIPDTGTWGGRPGKSTTPQQQILISLAGPGAGFVLAALTAAFIYAIGGAVIPEFYGLIPDFSPELGGTALDGNTPMQLLLAVLLWANVFWGVINLAPVFPLDGGQVAREMFIISQPWRGIEYSLWLSVIAGAIIAVLGFVSGDRFLAILFAMLAFSSYMGLQQMRGGGFGRPW